uniref:Uncharacterized protein n=1 Tax=Rhizophagus sp. (in: glomeromycetes) TaxID=1913635 RepID=A0A890JI90_9GLOM|nr:hypothetical protein [Rhizophagus sp. (in: glomeromycetes)]
MGNLETIASRRKEGLDKELGSLCEPPYLSNWRLMETLRHLGANHCSPSLPSFSCCHHTGSSFNSLSKSNFLAVILLSANISADTYFSTLKPKPPKATYAARG